MTEHHNEPREVAYSRDNANFYQDKTKDSWTSKDSKTIFSGCSQADLFLFAMALGANRDRLGKLKAPQKNVPISAMSEEQKWAILSIGIAKSKDLICLNDEKIIYSEAEKYADEGINIIKSHLDKHGLDYPKFLEAELKELMKNK